MKTQTGTFKKWLCFPGANPIEYADGASSLCSLEWEVLHDEWGYNYIMYTLLFSFTIGAGIICNISEIAIIQAMPSQKSDKVMSETKLGRTLSSHSPKCFRYFLLCLSSTHLVYLCLAIPLYPMAHSYPVTGYLGFFHDSIPYFLVYIEVTANTAYLFSSYSLLLMANYRFRYVQDGDSLVHLTVAELRSALRYDWLSIGCELKAVGIFLALYNLPNLFDTTVELKFQPCGDGEEAALVPTRVPAEFVTGAGGAYLIAYKLAGAILVDFVLPASAHLYLFGRTFTELRNLFRKKAEARSKKQTVNKSSSNVKDDQDFIPLDIEVGRAVNALVFFFLCSQFPSIVHNALMAMEFMLDRESTHLRSLPIAIFLKLLFVALGKFLIYSTLYDPFRHLVQDRLKRIPMKAAVYIRNTKETRSTLRELNLSKAPFVSDYSISNKKTSVMKIGLSTAKLATTHSTVSIARNLEKRISQTDVFPSRFPAPSTAPYVPISLDLSST